MYKRTDEAGTHRRDLRQSIYAWLLGFTPRYAAGELALPIFGLAFASLLAPDLWASLAELGDVAVTSIKREWALAVGVLATGVFLCIHKFFGQSPLSYWAGVFFACLFNVVHLVREASTLALAAILFSLFLLFVSNALVRRQVKYRYRCSIYRFAGTVGTAAPMYVLASMKLIRWSNGAQHLDMRSFCLLAVGALALWNLLRPSAGSARVPSITETKTAASIANQCDRSESGLMLMGDKSILLSRSQRSFLTYAKVGRTWVALYDPVGPTHEHAELVERFIALASRHAGTPAFYQVHAQSMQLYIDAGLTLMKVGEEAHIDLTRFDMSGPHRAHLRYAMRRAQRDGLTYEIAAPAQVRHLTPSLRQVSDAWLTDRNLQERCFSIAAFDDSFVAAQSAIVVRTGDAIVAFATFMTSIAGAEATVGVMRHTKAAPSYAMEYLFTQLALQLQSTGMQRLSLGIAPFSGMERTRATTLSHRLGRLIWKHGGRFYNFQGLRTFKDKFGPDWTPRYLAAQGNLGALKALVALPSLTRGKRT